nr:zeatin O-glucosyltransferase-like [Ipomoea batatas]
MEIAVVMVPLPAQGHLNQLLNLSRLISSYKIPVHYAGTTTHNRQARLRLQNWDLPADSDLHFHDFPLPPFETTPPPNPDSSADKFPAQIIPLFFATSHLRRPVEALVRRLCGEARRVVVIYDCAMAWVVQDVPSLPNAECYFFNSVSSFQIYTYFMEVAGKAFPADGPQVLREIPSLDGTLPDEFWEYWHIQEKFLGNSAGVLHNTCRVIEGKFLDLFEKEGVLGSLKQWAIGPFNPVEIIPERRDSDRRHESLKWLDNQPRNSVVFVSFGTTTTLSGQQIKELANALEKSRQKFVWVLRDADNADIFSGDDYAGGRRTDQLPEGYEERVRGRGIIVRDWAPQLDILAHPATGGFVTHCGWNSCMESMSMGVPMVAWPMHSDQPRNSVLVTKFLGIGVLVRDWERRREVVTSATIEQCIALLMDTPEGEEMRRKAAELSGAIKKSVMDGGGMRKELDSFILHISR